MKVIQITDEDAKALVESLELARWRGSDIVWADDDVRDIPEETRKRLEGWIHRHFHHVVVLWLQDQGATL